MDLVSPSTHGNVDEQISQLMQCKPLSESEVGAILNLVLSFSISRAFNLLDLLLDFGFWCSDVALFLFVFLTVLGAGINVQDDLDKFKILGSLGGCIAICFLITLCSSV